MPRQPSLQDFIDEELLRVPMTLDAVIDTVHERWRLRLPQHSSVDGDPARALRQHRSEVLAQTLRALRESAQADLLGTTASQPPHPTTSTPNLPYPASFHGFDAASSTLSLIDEDDVLMDIEMARCTQAIKQAAEAELRDLHTYTSALVHDLNVARDTNPFGPERFVRALWRGVQRLPLTRPVLAAFMHDAATPLAQALRKAYASASRRLQEQGVAPAVYRTIVFGGGTAWGSELARYCPPEDLHALHHSLPARLDAALAPGLAAGGAVASTPTATPAPGKTGAALPRGVQSPAQLVELLARLFDAMQAERGLAETTVALLQRLQPTVLRLTQHDRMPLEAYDHAVWRFMDQLAFDLECSAPAQRPRLLGLCRNLVDLLAATDRPETSNFTWAIVRLAAARRHSLEQAISAAAPQIERLQRIATDEASVATATMPLDVGTLDTVPAELLPEPDRPAAAVGAFSVAQASTPGTPLRCHLQGHWRYLTCLWRDTGHDLLLLDEPQTGSPWALRQSALARLLAENLARPMRVRSLVRRAADRLQRGVA